MRKEEERIFFSLFKNGGVADLCVQALTVKYDLDKHIRNSNEGHSDEEKSILYVKAVKVIKVAGKALKVDLDKLFDEIEENLNELTENEPQRKDYCFELLSTFGSQCSFIDTYMPIAAVKAHQHPKIELNEEEKDTLKIFKGFQMFYIATRENISQDGIVEEHYRSLFSLLQQYADRLDWVLMKKRIDLRALQNECGIYIKDMRMERSAWSYTKWAGSIKIAQKYIDALHSESQQLDKKYLHYHKDEEAKAIGQFERLVKGGYFSPEASLDDWLYIYGVEGKVPNKKPLEWQKTQKELAYMVRRIWQNTDTKIWEICENVFTFRGKKPNKQTMKSDLSRIDNKWEDRPRKFDRLDEVLKG